MTPTIEELARGLTEGERQLMLIAKSPGTAADFSSRHKSMTGNQIGHFARRSNLFEKVARTTNYVSVWKLTPLGLTLRAYLEKTHGGL